LPTIQQMLKFRQTFPSSAQTFQKVTRGLLIAILFVVASQKSQMTLKIEKDSDGEKTVIRLSGRLRSEHLDELKTQMDGDQSRIALDLDGVTLVDVEVIRFLNTCEESGVDLLHCWPYIREWIMREKDREG
jgi:hypothetical protein